MFVVSFKEQRPFLVNDVAEIEKKFSKRSRDLAKKLGVHALICVPIIYEGESLGILVVDNIRSKSPFTQSEVSLLMGVASQTAVSVVNAMSFKKLHESEDKYRTVLEANPDPVVVYDMKGKVTYFNPAFTSVFGWALEECLGKKARLNRLPLQPGDVTITCADVTRAKQLLDYNPSTTVKEGVESFVRWYKDTRK